MQLDAGFVPCSGDLQPSVLERFFLEGASGESARPVRAPMWCTAKVHGADRTGFEPRYQTVIKQKATQNRWLFILWRARRDYSGHPALRPAGRPAAVQIRSRRICRTEFEPRFDKWHKQKSHLKRWLFRLWRARRDSNSRPLPSEGSTLSS